MGPRHGVNEEVVDKVESISSAAKPPMSSLEINDYFSRTMGSPVPNQNSLVARNDNVIW